MRVNKVNIYKDIELENLNSIETIFINLWKSNISHQRGPFLKEQFYLGGLKGFRGGSEEKMRRMWLGLEIVMASLSPLIKKLNLKSKKNIFCVWLDRTLDTSIQNPPIIIPTLPSYKKNWKTTNNFLINMNPCPVSIVNVQPPVLINTLVHYLSPLFVSNNQESSLF